MTAKSLNFRLSQLLRDLSLCCISLKRGDGVLSDYLAEDSVPGWDTIILENSISTPNSNLIPL